MCIPNKRHGVNGGLNFACTVVLPQTSEEMLLPVEIAGPPQSNTHTLFIDDSREVRFDARTDTSRILSCIPGLALTTKTGIPSDNIHIHSCPRSERTVHTSPLPTYASAALRKLLEYTYERQSQTPERQGVR
jgi:hypothetical protein